MALTYWVFLGVMLLIFGLAMIILGGLTAYFGSGKSRKMGVLLAVIGLVVGLGWALFRWNTNPGEITGQVIIPGLFYIGAAIIGALIALGAFIAAIMKV